MKRLTCACGRSAFRLRIKEDEQVGLVTCEEGHHSLLLDSGDYWLDVIQDGKPTERKCKCGSKDWHIGLAYDRRDDQSIRGVSVHASCAKCKTARKPTVFEIDYEPTDALVTQPLVPCADPWLKARRVVITGLWTQADLDAVVTYALANVVYFAAWREVPRRITELPDFDRERSFDFFFTDLFFRSIHDTLDHILLIDRLILKYVEDGARPDMLLARQYQDFAALREARVAFDARLRSMAPEPEWLAETMPGRPFARALMLVQMFNHQTHHRSQVTTHLHLMGIEYGSTDLPYNPKRPTS
jgi:uncharacterized damage-inducible protein DinB